MGYELPDMYQGTYVLQFADPTFDGLEVRMRRHSFGAVEAAVKLRTIDISAAQRGELNLGDWGTLQEALLEFSEALIEWNLERDGKSVGTDYKSIRSVDLVFVLQIFIVWLKALIGVEWDDFHEMDIPLEVNE